MKDALPAGVPTTRSWIVARASSGAYDPSCLRLTERPVPDLRDGQLLIETRLLSLDPTHLNWIKLDPQLQYLPIGVGDAMIGTNIGVVRASRAARFPAGQSVMGIWGWSTLAVADAALVRCALPESEMPWEEQLTILSHVGQAAAGGMLLVGRVTKSDAVLVSAAAGATGSIAAQVATALGCRTVGIAGGAEKCRYLVDELGLDAAIDYRSEDLPAAIARLFPDGVDLFFDNVGGSVLDAVLTNMARGCRIVVCGAIAQYDAASSRPFMGVRNLPMLVFKQARMEGFVAGQFGAKNSEVLDHLLQLYRRGKLRVRTHVVAFDDVAASLRLLLSGANRGKLLARVGSGHGGNG